MPSKQLREPDDAEMGTWERAFNHHLNRIAEALEDLVPMIQRIAYPDKVLIGRPDELPAMAAEAEKAAGTYTGTTAPAVETEAATPWSTDEIADATARLKALKETAPEHTGHPGDVR